MTPLSQADIDAVIRSVYAAGEQAPAIGLLVVIAVSLAVGAVMMGIQALVAELMKPVANPSEEGVTDFRGPRSSYGDAIPFIFGTLQIRSPIVLYPGPVTQDDPYGSPLGDATTAGGIPTIAIGPPRHQYWSTIDLLLCERVHTDGAQVGTIQLRKIWSGQNMLWDGTKAIAQGGTPVTTSGNLLELDPNVGSEVSPLPGGIDTGGKWWFGGVVKEDPAYSIGAGVLLGWWTRIWSGMWAQFLGMERVDFYVGNGNEQPHGSIGAELFDVLWNTDFQYIYPSYHKFSRLVFRDFCWGDQPRIEDISAEVTVTCPAVAIGDTTGIMPNGLDVNPVSVLYTLLTHPDFCGGPKLPACDTDSFSAARQIINDEGFGMSYRLQAPMKAADLVDTILRHVRGVLYRDPATGLIYIALSRLVQTALPRFNETHVLELSDISKSTWAAATSQVRVTFEMRGMAGNEQGARNIAVAKDPGLAENAGLIETADITMATVYDPMVANEMAAQLLSDANTPLVKVAFKGNRLLSIGTPSVSLSDLRPGDMFTLDYSPLGLTNLRLRVLKVDLGTLDDNAVGITAIQDIYQAQAIIAPPGQPDGYTIVGPPTEVTISTYRMFTAPYYFARTGLGPDARRVLTTAPIYLIDSIPTTTEFAVNYDRFMMLAKAPYEGASTFQWTVQTDDGVAVYNAVVPYTECGTLFAEMSGTGTTPVGQVSSVTIEGLSLAGIGLLTSAPDKLLMIDDELFQVSADQVTVNEDGTSVDVAVMLRMLLDSDHINHEAGSPVWILDTSDPSWSATRLAPPMQSSVEEFWLFETEVPTDGQFNDFQTLLPGRTMRIRNIDSGRTNLESTADVQLRDRANRVLPVRQVNVASSTVSLDAAETDFTFDFEFSATAKLFQQREIGHLADVANSFELLLPMEQDSGDLWSAESMPGYLHYTREDDDEHVAKLEVWYEYLAGPLSGEILWAGVSDAGSGVFAFDATAEATTRVVRCYLRACFAPTFGEAGMRPIRRSRARTYDITLDRT